MPFPFDKYPWMNFQELNLAYFIEHFKEIFEQWASLYEEMTTWKDATTEELNAWKAQVIYEQGLWENELINELNQWKASTQIDITAWEQATLTALDEWKTAFETLFTSTFSNLTDIKDAAEAARDAAAASAATAEAAALQLTSSISQIAVNASNISALEQSERLLRQNIADVANAVGEFHYDKEYLVTPYNLQEDKVIYTELGTNGFVISGTKNKGTLYPIHQGTHIVNGLTIVATGNVITVDGTATANTYYSIADGIHKQYSQLADEEYELPPIDWWFTNGVAAGYQSAPAIVSRLKDNSGNSATIQGNTVKYNPETFGGLFFYIGNGSTIHRGAVLGLINNNTTAYQTQESARCEVIEGEDTYFNGVTGDRILADSGSRIYCYNQKTIKKPKFVYSTRSITQTGSQQVVDVYIPQETGYIDYAFARCQSSSASQAEGGGNTWKIAQIFYVDDEFNRVDYLTTTGETEMAIKIKGRSDLMGGIIHGDEWLIDGTFHAYLNEKPVADISAYVSPTEFDELKFLNVSNLYDPNDHSTIVAEHGCEWIFDETGLTLRQSVNFKGAYTMVNSYMPMLCVIRDHYGSTVQREISNQYYDDGDFRVYDVGTADFTGYPHNLKKNIKHLELRGTTNGYIFEVEIEDIQPGSMNGSGCWIDNADQYNKVYVTVGGYNQAENIVTNGTKWISQAKIKISKYVPA